MHPNYIPLHCWEKVLKILKIIYNFLSDSKQVYPIHSDNNL